MVLLIDNYDSFTFNVYQQIAKLGFSCKVIRNDEYRIHDIVEMNPSSIVISPGPGRPTDSGVSMDVLSKDNFSVPIFGICLGHQALGEAFGAKIIHAPEAVHGKISPIFHNDQDLFKGLPKSFKVARYHSLIIEKQSLPDDFEILAETQDNLIMGIKHRYRPFYGVQFHPESIATEFGSEIFKNFFSHNLQDKKQDCVA